MEENLNQEELEQTIKTSNEPLPFEEAKPEPEEETTPKPEEETTPEEPLQEEEPKCCCEEKKEKCGCKCNSVLLVILLIGMAALFVLHFTGIGAAVFGPRRLGRSYAPG